MPEHRIASEEPDTGQRKSKKPTDFIMVGAVLLGPVFAAVIGQVSGATFSGSNLLSIILVGVAYLALCLVLREILRHLRASVASKEKELASTRMQLHISEETGKHLKEQCEILRSESRETEAEQAKLQSALGDLDKELRDAQACLAHLKANRIRMIQPAQYVSIIHRLARRYGEGHLLLFNIELNTFVNKTRREQIWAQVGEIEEIRSVRLALPPDKFARWYKIVTGIGHAFFSQPGIQDKFSACEYQLDDVGGEDHIAFALYETVTSREHHDWGALFLINRPFIRCFEKGTHDYLHILEYNGEQRVLDLCVGLWINTFNPDWAESAKSIQQFAARKLHPMPLEELIREHDCDPERVDTMKRLVGARRFVPHANREPAPAKLTQAGTKRSDRLEFKLTYDYDPHIAAPAELLKGVCKGLDEQGRANPKPCIVWSSGFGDAGEPKLARIVRRELRNRRPDLAEVFFKKSGEIEESTCTRTYEDINAVVDYVADIPGVDRNRICVIGISLSGYLAAKLAAKNLHIGSVLMVLPPFDVVEMLDRFRAQYLERVAALRGEKPGRAPVFDDFLKARPVHRLPFWDKSDYCTYFNYTVRACHLADLAVKGAADFGRKSFRDAMESVTASGRRMAVVYGKSDPVVGASGDIADLKGQIDADHVKRECFRIYETSTRHRIPEPGGPCEYGVVIPDREEFTTTMINAIDFCLGNDVVSAARPGEADGPPPLKISAAG